MSSPVSLNLNYIAPFVADHEWDQLRPAVSEAHRRLHTGNGAGADFLGWMDLPDKGDHEELERIEKTAAGICEHADVFIVIGIGGSSLGAKAVISGLSHSFHSFLQPKKKNGPDILFLGEHFGSDYTAELLEALAGKNVYVNVISKSGTTTEPAIAFRIVKTWMEKTYGKGEAKKRIIATTDREKGALKTMANAEGYETFVVPDDVGGRYSVLTPVGLLPIAVGGISIRDLLAGAREASYEYTEERLSHNQAYQYAAFRYLMYQKGKQIELLSTYEPKLTDFSGWWKQLYGESEGKDGKGLFPASVAFTSDLHSMGQYVQEGRRHLFETVLYIGKSRNKIQIPRSDGDEDGLDFLAGEHLDAINKKAYQGTMLAHTDGSVPNLILEMEQLNAFSMGALIYFFEKACALSGYLLGVNPFDQPGVESYKQNMYALLGKPGHAKRRIELEERLNEWE
ncbi:glucose-6-phosphate isomerase [Salicibibacter halophilus]|uniref:Glucose-6-phosphate isomerase n=1 Tax=Salicibibacter halophilus TaxID=2502791 RepID=A0A514LHE5_9BACI|nr:glucose-6-phosphate isomerase [Salicibibacter halophilus]QDI91278.1 glucose-6-phosphate isomerase [Salicibibacter halophilus]